MKGALDSQLGHGCSDLDSDPEHCVQYPNVMRCFIIRKQRSTAHHACIGDTEALTLRKL